MEPPSGSSLSRREYVNASARGRGVAEQLFVDGGGGDALPRAVPVRVVAPPEQRARLFEGAPRGFDQRRLQVQEAKTLTLAQLAHHDGEARRLFRRSPRRRAVERPRVD